MFRSLNKQIKDKNDHKEKLIEDLKHDGDRQKELEGEIMVFYELKYQLFNCF